MFQVILYLIKVLFPLPGISGSFKTKPFGSIVTVPLVTTTFPVVLGNTEYDGVTPASNTI